MLPAIVPGLTPLERVTIDEGTFAMGSTQFGNAQPVTDVTLSVFQVSETKATVGQYCKEYLRAIGRNRITLAVTKPKTGMVSIVGRGRSERAVVAAYMKSLSVREKVSPGGIVDLGGLTVFEVQTPKIPQEFREFDDQPVVQVSWFELAAFAAAYGGRLPTEAQCERIMRGRSGKDEYGAFEGTLRTADGTKLAHFGESRTARVKTHPANSWGVFDASGNVFNWTDTWWQDSYKGLDTKDPRGPKEGEFSVVRGGAYNSGEDGLRAAGRDFGGRPGGRVNDVGGVVVWPSQDSKGV